MTIDAAAGKAPALAGMRVLIVEDEPAIAEMIRSAVVDSGGLVIGPAPDIESALAFIATDRVAVAVVDLIVGGTYCDAIAIELNRRSIPFAVATGIGADYRHPELRDAFTITKPFQAEHIQQALLQLLGQGTRRGRDGKL